MLSCAPAVGVNNRADREPPLGGLVRFAAPCPSRWSWCGFGVLGAGQPKPACSHVFFCRPARYAVGWSVLVARAAIRLLAQTVVIFRPPPNKVRRRLDWFRG